MKLHRRPAAALAFLLAFGGSASSEALRFEVFKTQSCGCCVAWVKRLEEKGHTVNAMNLPMATLIELKVESGIPPEMTSCHTAKIGGYTIEGHVPVGDIERLLRDKPNAVGLAVAGMPMGSPGMEYGGSRDAFDVLLINRDGTTAIFSSYSEVEG